jgi:hypothetical protein
MEWYQVATIVLANLGLFLWTVRQSRTDYLHCQRSIDSFKDAMLKETKEFHGRLERIDCEFKMRLCAIEERNKK